MKARIVVMLKPDVLDPQGQAIVASLHQLGFHNVESVRQGKCFDVQLREDRAEKGAASVTAITEALLANPVVEDYRVIHGEVDPPAGGLSAKCSDDT